LPTQNNLPDADVVQLRDARRSALTRKEEKCRWFPPEPI